MRTGGSLSEFHVGAIDGYQSWVLPEFTSNNDDGKVDPEQGLVVGAGKHTVVAWSRRASNQRDVWFRYQRDGVQWLPPRPLEQSTTRESTEPLVAIDGSGNALIVWTEGDDENSFNDVRAAWATSTGALYGPTTIDTADGNVRDLCLGMNSSGEGVIGWSQRGASYDEVYVSRFTLGAFGAPEHMDTLSDASARISEVHMSENRNAFVFYRHMRYDLGFDYATLLGRFRAHNWNNWSSPNYQDSDPRGYRTVRPVEDARNHVHFAWRGREGDRTNVISAKRWTDSLSDEGSHDFDTALTNEVQDLKLSIHPDGGAALAWSSQPDGASVQTLLMSVRPRDEGWRPARVMGARDSDQDKVLFSLASQAGGSARVLWSPRQEYDGVQHQVLTRTMRADGTRSDVVPVDRENGGVSGKNALLMSHAGKGIAVWERYEISPELNLWGASLR